MKFSSSLAVAATTFSGLSAAWGVDGSWNGHPHKAPARNVNATQICTVLAKALPNLVSLEGSPVYTQEQTGLPDAGYWSVQESSLMPACRVTPTCALEVSAAVAILVAENIEFAVRGGGHTSWAGAANIGSNGVTIDLSDMNEVVVANNNATVAVGGGARWIDVYNVLVEQDLMVCGGRVAPVGVGGLTTGGGKCFFSSTTGFAADGVAQFELVTSSGLILEVNAVTFPSLFKALKGGNNNFGIVTKFWFKTFAQGNMWGGQVIYLPTSESQQYSALYNLIEATGDIYNPPNDAQVINAYVNGAVSGQLYVNYYTNTQPQPWPSQLAQFQAIEPVLEDTTRIANITSFAHELATGTPNGQFYVFGTLTFENNEAFMSTLKNLSDTIFGPLIAAKTDPALQTSMVLQPLTKAMLNPGCGKNSLGLCPSDGNLVFVDLTVSWALESSSAVLQAASNQFVAQATAMASAAGVLNEYIYLNYALQTQDPIASYGAANQAQLRAVSKQFDPTQTFQKLVPGGFKLYR